MDNRFRWLPPLVFGALLVLGGCASHTEKPMQAVEQVDIPRFMGDWYVIATIPTYFERNALNPLENYQLNPDGSVATTFTFNKGSSDGPEKTMRMTGFVSEDPGVWQMQWKWPVKADYRIAHVDSDYRVCIVGRNKRDYLWIMARTPGVSQDVLEELIGLSVDLGYDRERIQLSNWQTAPHPAADDVSALRPIPAVHEQAAQGLTR